MADPKDTKLQQIQLREIETQLASVEQRMQRLALLKKSIELKLIDPKDSQRFDLFLKKLASADTKNIESLRGFITGAADKFDELIHNNQIFSRESESALKTYIKTDKQFANIVSKIDLVNKSIIEMNVGLEEANELVDEFLKGAEESLEEYMDLDKVQASIESSMRKMTQAQKQQIKNAFGLNSSYDTVSNSISDINYQLKDATTPVRQMIEFDLGATNQLENDLKQVMSGLGKQSFTFDGKEFSSQFVEPMLRGVAGSGELLAKNMSDRIDVLKKIIQKKSKETAEVVDAMIKDLEAKQIDPNAQILSPEMQGKVEAAWGRIQKKGNAALMDLISGTVQSSTELSILEARLKAVSINIDSMAQRREDIAKTFGMLERAMESGVESLQYATRDLMPNWLYQTLGLDSAFQNITSQASNGLKDAAAKISQGASVTETLSGFAGSFASNLLKSLGVIGLIVIAVTSLWKMMSAAGESVRNISKEFGVSNARAYDMYTNILKMTSALDNTTMKQEDILEVLKKHRDEYGLIMDLNNKANQESIKFAAQLGKQYGIGAGEAYGFVQQLQQLGADKKTSEELAAVAAYASEIGGVSFNNVVKDLAESSEFVARNFAGYPEKAVKAAVKIRAMGSSLKQVEKGMEKVMDFQSFTKGMTELNIMTKGVVNLSKYMNLAASLAPAEVQMKELNAQFDKMVDSGQANYYNMKQFAELTGQSDAEMMRGYKIRKEQATLGKENVELLTKYLDRLSDADVADAKSAMRAAKRLQATEKLDATWASIKDTLTLALLPALEFFSTLLSALTPVLKIIGILLKGLAIPLAILSDLFSVIFGDFDRLKKEGTQIGKLFGEWNGFLSTTSNILITIVGIFASIWAYRKIAGMFSGIFPEGTGKAIKESAKALFSKDGLARLKDAAKSLFSKDSLKNLADKTKSLFSKDSLKNLADKTKSLFSKDGLKNLGEKAKSLFKKKSPVSETIADAVPDSSTNTSKNLSDSSTNTSKNLSDSVTNTTNKTGSAFTRMGDILKNVGNGIKNVLTFIRDFILQTLTKLARAISDSLASIGSGISKLLTSIGTGVGKFIENTLGGIGKGLQKFGPKALQGAAALIVVSGALWIASKALQNFATVSWESVTMGLVTLGGLAIAAKLLGNATGQILQGALAIALLGASILPLAYGLSLMKDVGPETLLVLAGGLTVLGIAAAVLGSVLPLMLLGAAAIAALGVSIIPLAYALNLAQPALEDFGKIIKTVFKGAATVIESIGKAIKSVGQAVSNIVDTIASSIVRMSQINAANLFSVALGITAVAGAIAGFGFGSAIGGIGSAIGDFFGGGTLDNLEKLAALSDPLTLVASAIQIISKSIESLNASLESINIDKLGKIKDALNTSLVLQVASAASTATKIGGNQVTGTMPTKTPATKISSNQIKQTASSNTQKINGPAKVAPLKNVTNISETVVANQQLQSPTNQISSPRTTNQDAILKQMMTTMQDVANRPVIVHIGGLELKSLNKKLKVYNS